SRQRKIAQAHGHVPRRRGPQARRRPQTPRRSDRGRLRPRAIRTCGPYREGAGWQVAARCEDTMPFFEFSKWDGSHQFRPLSADALFDKIAEHLIEHGDYVLRQFEELDDRDAELMKLLVKEGYLEKDEEGKYAVAPRGIQRIETKALDELFTIQRKDTLG